MTLLINVTVLHPVLFMFTFVWLDPSIFTQSTPGDRRGEHGAGSVVDEDADLLKEYNFVDIFLDHAEILK